MRATSKCALLVASALGLMLLAWRPASAQPSVAFQINRTHDGAATFPEGLNLPLRKVWSRTFPPQSGSFPGLSYPIIVGGKVFFTVTASPPSAAATKVVALSLRDGRQLWAKGLIGSTQYSGLAYDNGRLFAITFEGLLFAIDSNTGATVWRKNLRDVRNWAFSVPPMGGSGMIYVIGTGSAGTLFAVDQLTGRVVWNKPIAGTGGSPTVSPEGVFVAATCQSSMFDAKTGALRWELDAAPGCSGGDQHTAPYYQGRVYANFVRPTMLVFNARTGTPVYSFEYIWKPPAFHNGIGYFPTEFEGLIAWSIAGRRVLWKRYDVRQPALPPIVVNGKVIAVSQSLATSVLHVLDGQTGAILQELPLPGRITDNGEGSGLPKGVAAGQGMIIVTTDDTLFALKPAPAP